MSVDSEHRRIESINRELAQLHKKLATERKKEADAVKKIGQIERSITRNTSESMLKSKAKEIERQNREIERIKKRQADISSQIAKKEKLKFESERKLAREQQREQASLQKRQERQLQQYRADVRRQLSSTVNTPGSEAEIGSVDVFDVFISHATEDKDDFVRPLAEALKAREVRVWYDDFELKVGDSLRRSIDLGLAKSRYGIVVLSSAFLAKNWPQYELDGLVTKEMSSGGKVILPIWHKVSKDEVADYSPTLADKVALNTSMLSLQEIVEQLVATIHPQPTAPATTEHVETAVVSKPDS